MPELFTFVLIFHIILGLVSFVSLLSQLIVRSHHNKLQAISLITGGGTLLSGVLLVGLGGSLSRVCASVLVYAALVAVVLYIKPKTSIPRKLVRQKASVGIRQG